MIKLVEVTITHLVKNCSRSTILLHLIVDEYDLDLIFREISIELNKQLYNKSDDIYLLEEKIKKLEKIKELNSQKYQKIIMNLMFNFNLSQKTKDIINQLNFILTSEEIC